jgi:hypothetical protein
VNTVIAGAINGEDTIVIDIKHAGAASFCPAYQACAGSQQIPHAGYRQ